MDSESQESIMELRASLSLRLVTGLTLVMCVVLVSQALALMTETWDPCSVIGGIVFATLPSVFAAMQYTATFRCNRKATHGSIVLWAILALVTLIGLSSIIAEMSKHRFSFGWSYLIAGFSVILSVILMTSLYAPL